MDLKQIEYFVRVAELGSFSKAALVVRLPQPSLSRHVRRLELELRETLFERTGRGVRLTDAGRRLFDHATTILQLVARARDEVGDHRGEAVGRVAVGLPPSIGRSITPRLIDAFKRRYPQARLAVVEGLSAHLVEWIVSGRVDLALVHHPDPHEAIELTPLLDEAMGLVGPRQARDRRAAPARPLPLRELPRYPLIVPDRSHTMRRLLEAQAVRAGVELTVAWEVSSIPSILDLVVAGHGHAVLTATAVAISGRADALSIRRLVQPEINSTLCLVGSATRRRTPLAEQVAAMLATLIGALPKG